jgi:ribonuclease HI
MTLSLRALSLRTLSLRAKNTAELKAQFEAMKIAKEMLGAGHKVQILSDFSYAVKVITQRAAGSERKNWTCVKSEVLANA